VGKKKKEGEKVRRIEFGRRPSTSSDEAKAELKSVAQSVQKVENKRITTEGHGAARKNSV
jgi:outer membrane protein OmpA-like peptidoglycan-associated protein